MEEFHHFSHDHPLIFFEDKEVDEDPKPYFCSICGLPILCSPSYTCSISGCKFFLHKPCAHLPRILKKPRYHPVKTRLPHTLSLEPNGESSPNFTYKCKDENCKSNLHPLATGAVEIKVKHKSHQPHPLVAMCRETLSLCDACGEEHRGFFFSCQECNFWIHPDCALLSSDLKITSYRHPFILIYSLSEIPVFPSNCIICHKEMLTNIGFYYYGRSDSYAHVSCAKLEVDNRKTETRVELIQLPDDEDDAYPSLVIRRRVEEYINPIAHLHHQDDKKLMTINEKYHKHPNLFLHDDRGITSSSCSSRETSNLVCDVCVQPILISSPFYTCQLQSDDEYCHFCVHNICADLLSKMDFLSPSRRRNFFYGGVPCPNPSNYVFDSVFTCIYCHRPCNGFCCLMRNAPFFVDLECKHAPNTTKHASHRQHILVRTSWRMDMSTNPPACCSSGSLYQDVYSCFICDFCIHVRCALLPKRTQHKFDEHPLELITHHNRKECCFCEFCERDIEQQYWHYGCGKCEHYFHINCIPSVGYLSKIKFGKAHVDDKIHQHPLTLTRMLTHGRHERCGYCKEIIRGFVDEMAFCCCECDFWIHFSCARDSSCAPKLRVYWQVQEEAERLLRQFLNRAV